MNQALCREPRNRTIRRPPAQGVLELISRIKTIQFEKLGGPLMPGIVTTARAYSPGTTVT